MLVWATIAALLVLVAFALISLAWLERDADVPSTDEAPDGWAAPTVTPTYLRRVRIPSAGRGYDRAVVDGLLARAAVALDRATATADDDSGQVFEDGGSDRTGSLDG